MRPKVDNTIEWEAVEVLLQKYYETGQSTEGERAYSPMLPLKCFLWPKWLQIKSEPELESQINDRISFQSCLQFPMDYSSLDRSRFFRFRKRLSKEAKIKINREPLKQFHQDELSINEGVAVDARLVKSANRSQSNKKMGSAKS